MFFFFLIPFKRPWWSDFFYFRPTVLHTLNGINFQSTAGKLRPQIPLLLMGFVHLSPKNALKTYLPVSNFQPAGSKMVAKFTAQELHRREKMSCRWPYQNPGRTTGSERGLGEMDRPRSLYLHSLIRQPWCYNGSPHTLCLCLSHSCPLQK